MTRGFAIGAGIGRMAAAAIVATAWTAPAHAADVEWRSERMGNQPAVVLYNRLSRAVQCTASYDTPNGTGGIFGNRRNFIVPATGRAVAVTGSSGTFASNAARPSRPHGAEHER